MTGSIQRSISNLNFTLKGIASKPAAVFASVDPVEIAPSVPRAASTNVPFTPKTLSFRTKHLESLLKVMRRFWQALFRLVQPWLESPDWNLAF